MAKSCNREICYFPHPFSSKQPQNLFTSEILPFFKSDTEPADIFLIHRVPGIVALVIALCCQPTKHANKIIISIFFILKATILDTHSITKETYFFLISYNNFFAYHLTAENKETPYCFDNGSLNYKLNEKRE